MYWDVVTFAYHLMHRSLHTRAEDLVINVLRYISNSENDPFRIIFVRVKFSL